MLFPNKSKPHAIRTKAVMTSSYVAASVFSVDEHNYVGILVDYTKGDETSIQVKIESSIDGGTNYGQQSSEGSPSSGEIAVSAAFRTFTATGKYWIVVSPIKADTIKVSVKSTGGTPTGTVGLDAITGWV